MSRFVSQGTKRFDLGNDEYIEYREKLSYKEMEPILAGLDAKNEAANIKMALPMLQVAITDWRLKGEEEGTTIPFSKEIIESLDSQTILQIFSTIFTTYFPESQKKNSAI